MNQFKTVALLGLLSGFLVVVGYSLGGSGGALIGLLVAAATNLFSWYSSDKIALAAYQARPVSPQEAPDLYQMVQRLCQRASLPMPKLYRIPTMSPNAFATGRDPQHAAVAVTDGIVKLLPPDELEAVIAHELGHIKNRDTLTQAVAATIAGAISFLAQFGFLLGGRDDRQGNPLAGLLFIILAPIAATVIQLAISRTREFGADTAAAEMTGNPRALARALQRIEQSARQMPLNGNPAFSPLLIINVPRAALSNLFSTHPSTEARVQNLLKLEQKVAMGR
jgi:heat shock protein HtpX